MVLFLVILALATCHLASAGLSEQQKQDLLDQHNYLRSNLASNGDSNQPGASNMIALRWDDDAARIAQGWAERCIPGHEKNNADRNYATYTYVGQNWAGSTGGTYLDGVKMWYDEIKGYTYSNGACSNSPCGHYTQVVWAKSTAIGCGMADCSNGVGGGYAVTLVCNYAPGGNTNYEKPYETGKACSKCPEAYPFCLKGLCTAKEDCTGNNCQCPLSSCQNGGTVDKSTCTCKCKTDYYGDNCEKHCKDTLNWCDAATDDYCTYSNVIEGCPKRCGLCKNDPRIPNKNKGGLKVKVTDKLKTK